MSKPEGKFMRNLQAGLLSLTKMRQGAVYCKLPDVGHPGCTLKDMIEMAEYVRDHGGYTEQVQTSLQLQ
jgi:radical SAM superfamily enzyme YgiQ (UPF0313 family)